MKHKQKNSFQSGFTLVEMGIVMVIIALLVAGIMAGQNLIQAATIKATISQIEGHQTAFNNFADRFQAFPGDFRRASDFLGVTTDFDGNGDTQMVWNQIVGTQSFLEGPLAWYHLQLAGMINGQFGNTTALASEDATPFITIPTSKIGGDGGGYAMNYDGTAGGLGNYLLLGLFKGAGTGINSNPLLTARQAHDIDRKLDDNFPTSGLIRANQINASECFDATTTPEYILTSETVFCWIHYKLD